MAETAVASRQGKTRRARTKRRGKIDYTLFIVILILLVFGLVMVYSTSYYTANLKYDSPAYWLKRQTVFAGIGIMGMLLISRFDYHWWRNKSWILFLIVHLMLVYVLLFGEVINGAKRWIYIGPLSIQPSEIAKLSLILSFARLLDINANRIGKVKNMIFTCLWILLVIALVGIENFSTAIILVGIAGVMLFVAAPRLKPILVAVAVAGVMVVILFSLKGYRGERFSTWLDPTSSDKGYQTVQSLYAIGSGGLTGKGLGQSLQKLGFIPEAHNDMIFSIVCEELGFVGAIGVIALFVVLLFRLYRIVVNAADLYGALIVVGVLAHIGLQVLVNVAVVTNTIPNTGVPLPFISYGGTSVCFLLAELGIVLSVARTVQREK